MTVGGSVRTVLGPIAPEEVAYAQVHEHLLSDLSGLGVEDASGGEDGTGPWHERHVDQEAIRPQDYQWIRRYQGHHAGNLKLTDVEVAVEELCHYRQLGGRTIVDCTCVGIGRNPAGLVHIARATGLNVVMGSGYYVHQFHPPGLASRSVADIRVGLVEEIKQGVGSPSVPVGIIGEIGLSWPVEPVEDRVLRAAAQAQAETGLPLQVHPGRAPEAPFDALERIMDAGGRVDRTIMCHMDRTVTDCAELLRLASTGCYVAYDLFGYESSYYQFAPIDMPNDGRRIDFIAVLCRAGFADRVLISSDIAQKVRLRTYGGEGYGHILENVLPVMRRKGLSVEAIETITRSNPATILTVQ